MRNWTIGALAAVAGVALSGQTIAQTSPPDASKSGTSANMKLTKSECDSLWNQANSGGAASLSKTQAQTYVKDFSSVDSNGDGKLTQAEFSAGCDKGHVQSSAGMGAGSGSTGSDSSTGSGATGSGSN